MLKVERKSNSGSTKFVDKVYFDINDAKSYASYVLLKNYYTERDKTNIKSYSYRMRKIAFSRNFLKNVLNDEGCLTCTYCKQPDLIIEENGMNIPNSKKATIDHVVPISKGGGVFDVNNITVACDKCNSKKSDMSLEDFLKIMKPYLEVSN